MSSTMNIEMPVEIIAEVGVVVPTTEAVSKAKTLPEKFKKMVIFEFWMINKMIESNTVIGMDGLVERSNLSIEEQIAFYTEFEEGYKEETKNYKTMLKDIKKPKKEKREVKPKRTVKVVYPGADTTEAVEAVEVFPQSGNLNSTRVAGMVEPENIVDQLTQSALKVDEKKEKVVKEKVVKEKVVKEKVVKEKVVKEKVVKEKKGKVVAEVAEVAEVAVVAEVAEVAEVAVPKEVKPKVVKEPKANSEKVIKEPKVVKAKVVKSKKTEVEEIPVITIELKKEEINDVIDVRYIEDSPYDEETMVETKEFEIDGVIYLKCIAEGAIYDRETDEFLGMYNEVTKTIDKN